VRTSTGRARGRPRRRSVWGDLFQTITPAPNVAELRFPLSTLETKAAYNIIGSTVVRMIGHVAMTSTPVGSVNWHCGIAIFPDTIDAADVDPSTDPFLDWMWVSHERYGSMADEHHGIGPSSNRVDFDLRSKRRLDEAGDQLTFVLLSTVATEFFVAIRTLVLLP